MKKSDHELIIAITESWVHGDHQTTLSDFVYAWIFP